MHSVRMAGSKKIALNEYYLSTDNIAESRSIASDVLGWELDAIESHHLMPVFPRKSLHFKHICFIITLYK